MSAIQTTGAVSVSRVQTTSYRAINAIQTEGMALPPMTHQPHKKQLAQTTRRMAFISKTQGTITYTTTIAQTTIMAFI